MKPHSMRYRSGQVRLRRRRKRLFRDDPHCSYCGVELVEAPNVPNEATIEHTVSRLHPLRGKIHGRRLLVCRQCNNEHNVSEERAMSTEELWRRAGHLERMLAQKEPCP